MQAKGFAEAIARDAIIEADRHGAQPPEDNGRDRFRSPFVETIVFGSDEVKILSGCFQFIPFVHAGGVSGT
jgi:hypothetical protein